MTARHHAAWISGAVLLVAALVLSGVGRGRSDAPLSSPAGTVAAFLQTATERHDAVGACDFLAPTARDALGGPARCRSAMTAFGRRAPHDLRVDGSGRRVVVTGVGAPRALEVVPLAVGRRPEEVAPATGWRIAGDVSGLVRAVDR